jgi:hypothetical protein
VRVDQLTKTTEISIFAEMTRGHKSPEDGHPQNLIYFHVCRFAPVTFLTNHSTQLANLSDTNKSSPQRK